MIGRESYIGLGGDGVEGGGSESGPGEGLVGVSVGYEGQLCFG